MQTLKELFELRETLGRYPDYNIRLFFEDETNELYKEGAYELVFCGFTYDKEEKMYYLELVSDFYYGLEHLYENGAILHWYYNSVTLLNQGNPVIGFELIPREEQED